MDMRFVAIEKPFPYRSRKHSPFKASYSATLDMLERELKHLAARDIVVEADCDRSEVRLDGLLRSNARLRSAGIVLSFQSKHGPLRYPCDTYVSHEANLRAIALSLEALRTVDRYGVTRRAEQYKGWQALPPAGSTGETNDVTDDMALIVGLAGAVETLSRLRANPEFFRAIKIEHMKSWYRAAAFNCHPDRGGQPGQMEKLNAAWDRLEKGHFKGGGG